MVTIQISRDIPITESPISPWKKVLKYLSGETSGDLFSIILLFYIEQSDNSHLPFVFHARLDHV